MDTIRYGYSDTTKFEKLGYGYGGDTFVKNIILTIFSNAVCIKIKPKAKDNLIKKKDFYKTKESSRSIASTCSPSSVNITRP